MTEQGVGRVMVIGAGLGGLTLAHALVRAGIDVRVYEADDGSGERLQGYRLGRDRSVKHVQGEDDRASPAG